jgi:type I restriction enzyme, S subunit
MKEVLEDIKREFKVDRSDWKPVRFGQVAIQKKESVDRDNTNLTWYIKGEHMESENLHIRQWGELADEYLGPAFIRKFNKGDILYGSRRTYLRKVAIAHFDGITSNTTFVVNANEKLILKELLPFVMLSEGFAQHSIKNSKGSVNPYINWKDIANYEFLLPPKDQQAQLAELLWAADEVVEKDKKLFYKLSAAFNSEIEYLIHGITVNSKTINQVIEELKSKTKLERLENLGTFLKGKGIPKSDVQEDGIPCIRYGELYTKHHRIVRRYYSFISKEIASESFRLKKNDVMFAGSGETIEEIGKSAAFVDDIEAYAGSDTLIFRPDNMNGFYLGYLLNSGLVRHQLNKLGTGATVMHIYPSDLKKIVVPKIERAEQDRIAEKLESFELSRKGAENKIHQSKQLQKSLINQIF